MTGMTMLLRGVAGMPETGAERRALFFDMHQSRDHR